MATPVELPKSGNTVEECLIGRWLKQTGDPVAAGDIVAEVETDKATFEIVAPVSGTMLATFFAEGALVPVFTTVCVIGEPGEAFDAFGPDAAGASRKSQVKSPQSPSRLVPSPLVPSPLVPQSPVRSAAVSPRARRFASERGFTVPSLVGSGPGGRVLERDVRRAYDSIEATSVAPPPRLSHTRAVSARRMRESLASTAPFTLRSSVDAAGLLTLREAIKTRRPEVTINALVTFCAVRALLETPGLNAELIDGAIVNREDVHIGFTCDTPRGLLVPVVRNAHALSIGRLAQRLSELGTRAVDDTLSAEDLSGATFTISHCGDLGVESFTPAIDSPQVAILSVGAIQVKPVRMDGRVVFIDAIGLSLTCDQQAIDAAIGARFLQTLKEKIASVEYDLILRNPL